MKVDYKDNSKQVLSAMEKGIKNGLEAIGLTAETYAKKETPVDTGRLRNSISHTVDGEATYIGSNVEYAAFVQLNWEQVVPKHTICCRKPQRSTAQSTNDWQKMQFTAQSTTHSNIKAPNITDC